MVKMCKNPMHLTNYKSRDGLGYTHFVPKEAKTNKKLLKSSK